MRIAEIYRNGILAGVLKEQPQKGFVFLYNDQYFMDITKPSISVTLSKKQQVHECAVLFPFFYNMLSEGVNKQLQCNFLKIDEEDDFGLLLHTAQYDTIGAITIKAI